MMHNTLELPEAINAVRDVSVPTMDGGAVTVRVGAQAKDPRYWDRCEAHGREACEWCGRQVGVGQSDLWIYVLYGGDIVHPDDVPALMERCDGLVGWYRVGPTCAKKYGDWVFTVARMKAAAGEAGLLTRAEELLALSLAVEKLPYRERLRASGPLGRAEAANQWLRDDPDGPDANAAMKIYRSATRRIREIIR